MIIKQMSNPLDININSIQTYKVFALSFHDYVSILKLHLIINKCKVNNSENIDTFYLFIIVDNMSCFDIKCMFDIQVIS
jgi:hypothetical protein